ncbi:uncharacterized protein [Panulirus ornatus]|uniref:uncharacterized protein isoform X2 n=2 Tax=Panulirus ornatus TaxID=150431 RepID=UPI003A8BC95F
MWTLVGAMLPLQRVGLLLVLLAGTGAWDHSFQSWRCYEQDLENLEDRLPLSIGNLVALIEKWEKEDLGSYYFVPDRIAAALVKRYRLDGIVYKTVTTQLPWPRSETPEVDKQDIMKELLVTEETVPDNIYDPREECSLHFMLSHSTDIYPHPGLDKVWYDARVRRSTAGRSDSRRRRSDPYSTQNADVRYILPEGQKPAKHPIENGVIWTPYGPIAAGTLLAGITATPMTDETTIRELYGEKSDYMPDEMRNKRLHPQHVSTLAGDIGQSAMVGAVVPTASNRIYLGPTGLFVNATAAPKLFTLKDGSDGITSYFSRAELFAGIDAMLIQKVLRESSSNMKLSQVLRMYYSDHGLPNHPEYRACNRMAAFKDLDANKIKEQALNFMYAYTDKFSDIQRVIIENPESFPEMETKFQDALNRVWSSFKTFVDTYKYEDYHPCSVSTKNEAKCENNVDLLIVFGHEGGVTEIDKEREYITHLSQLLGVGRDRSRLGIMDGKNGKWMFPMTNFTNVADWGSNFTMNPPGNVYGSGKDMKKVLKELKVYYTAFFTELHNETDNAKAHAQVVLWNVPSNMPDDKEYLKEIEDFKKNFPDVYFLLVGRNKNNFNELLVDPDTDFFLSNIIDVESFAATLAKRICKVPSVFAYPACADEDYNEGYHKYVGYVSPNFTTYIRISPKYFHFSPKVILKVDSVNIQVCARRMSTGEDIDCRDGDGDFEWEHLCGRWLDQCDAIYLEVTGKSNIGSICGQDDECQYPNQIKFDITHDGMTCGAWAAAASSKLLLLLLAFTLFIHS